MARFRQQTYTITVNAGTGGTTSGGGQYHYGETATLTAEPADDCYVFLSWNDGNIDNPRYVTVTDNATYTANFSPKEYTITVNAGTGGIAYVGNNTGTTSYTFACGVSCTVYATANAGYTFTNWTENGTIVSPNTDYTFNVIGNRTLVANFIYSGGGTAPTGAINGKFTINANGDKVYFSQGNLQYNAAQGSHQCADGTTKPGTWRFAENQWDYIGSDNSNISQTYNGWIDLFGWGTSGYHDSSDPYNVNYQPWSTSSSIVNEDYNRYGYGPSMNMPSPYLTGSSANYDWGVYIVISNGSNQASLWRTLTELEWHYLYEIRSTSTVNGVLNARFARAKVANVKGLLLFPDSYMHPSGVAQPIGINETEETEWIGNDYSVSDFALMQAAGAVFLPAAGCREGTSVLQGGYSGYYWTATCNSNYNYNGVSFRFNGFWVSLDEQYNNRYCGQSVRLVCPAEN